MEGYESGEKQLTTNAKSVVNGYFLNDDEGYESCNTYNKCRSEKVSFSLPEE